MLKSENDYVTLNDIYQYIDKKLVVKQVNVRSFLIRNHLHHDKNR